MSIDYRDLGYGEIGLTIPTPEEPKRATNADRIRAMTDEELAEYLFDRGNGCEYCYGICAFQDECDGQDHAQEFCLEQIVRWLKQEVEE